MNEKELASRITSFVKNIEYLEMNKLITESSEQMLKEIESDFARGDMSKIYDTFHSVDCYCGEADENLKEEYEILSNDLKEYMLSRTAAHVTAVLKDFSPEEVRQQLMNNKGRRKIIIDLNNTISDNSDISQAIKEAKSNVFACIRMLE